MNNDKTPQTARKAIENLDAFLNGPEEDVRAMPIEAVQKELESMKINVSPLIEMVKKRLVAERLRIAKEKKEQIDVLLAHQNSSGEAKPSRRERILDMLRGKPQMAVLYRKFEEATDSDAESMLEDMNILELLDESDRT